MSESIRSPKPEPDIYSAGTASYGSILQLVNKTVAFWRWCTFVSLVVILSMGIGLVKIANQSNIVPLLVVMDDNQVPYAVYQTEASISRDDPRIIAAALARFMTSIRSVSSDVEFQKRRIHDLVLFVSRRSPAFTKISALIQNKETNPFERLQKHTVSIKITVAVRLSERTWQVSWQETVYQLDGSVSDRSTWQSNITFDYLGEVSAETALINPTGLVVTDFNWTKVRGANEQ